MRCLACGCLKDLHVRGDGACVGCACGAFVQAWPVEKPAVKPSKGEAK
jgi:hypothetical protein